MCGTSSWMWDPEQGGDENAFIAVRVICPGCQRKDWLRTDEDTKPMAGSSVALLPRKRAEELEQGGRRRPKGRRRRG